MGVAAEVRELLVTVIHGGESGRLPRRPRWLRQYAVPLLLAVTFLTALAAYANADKGGAGLRLVTVAGVLPLAVVRWRPLYAWGIGVIAVAFSESFPSNETSWPWAPTTVLVMIVVLVTVAATQRFPITVGVWAVTIGLVIWQAATNNQVGITLLVTVVMVIGDQVRRRSSARRELAVSEERNAVLAERARIAREMHDVVAHHLSMIAVRAETAPYRLGDVAEDAASEFGAISSAARDGLVEMRRLLGVLRSDSQEILTAPQPGLDAVPALVTAARDAGATVEFRPAWGVDVLPAGVQLAAYRIVQEALSNATRHAPGAPITVDLVRSGDALTVAVRNASGGEATDDAEGHGLIGMRERVAMLGGTFAAQRTADGGFSVAAELPTSVEGAI